MKRAVLTKYAALCVVVLSLSVLACRSPTGVPNGAAPTGDTPTDTSPTGASAGALTFDLTGAKAVGAADMAASRAIRGLSDFQSIRSAISRSATDEFGLVRIMDDGTVELAMQLPAGAWMPRVLFIAKSPVAGSKDLYVAFEGPINYNDSSTGQWVSLGSFLHILEDGTYYSIISQDNGRVKNYSWYGNDNYKPVSFDASGRMYFVFENWSSSNSSNQLFQYDPATHTSTPLTPALSGTYYNNFEVSPDGQRLFVQGERQSGGSRSSFFRMYPLADIENPVSIYYSSNSNIWVRGYKVSPAGAATQNVILNGNGIRGINGLLRANVLSDSSIGYEPLFDSNNSQWFNPEYNEWYSEWEAKTYYEGYFDRFSSYDTYIMMTDGTDVFYVNIDQIRSSTNWYRSDGYLQSTNVFTTPEATDWVLQGQTQKDLKPVGTTGLFGFAKDNGGGTYSVVIDPVATEGNSAVTTDVRNSSYTILTYYNNLSAAQKAALKVYSVQWRNGNGTSARVKVAASVALIDPLLVPTTSTVYAWNAHWQNTDGSLKKAEVLAYAGKYFVDDVLFKYGTNAAGDASLTAFVAKGTYTAAEIGQSTFFLDTYFVKADGSQALTFKKYREQNGLQWLNFQNVSSLFYDDTGACWAAIGGSMWGGSSSTVRPIKILDSAGRKALEYIPSLSSSTYNPVSILVSGNRMFFRDGLLDADGFESGYHKLYVLDVTAPSAAPTDLLANVPENGRIEIVSFSVSNDILYFTGVKGTGVIGGKIDISTLAYTALSDEYMLRNIEAY